MRAICICLPEYPERIENAKAHFASHGLDVEFLYGINAPLAGLATWHPYEVDHPGSGFRMGAKPTGCWLSHYMAWNVCTRLPDDAFLILEDDAQLHDGFMADFEQALKDVPSDYSFLHVGHCCSRQGEHIAGKVHAARSLNCTHAYVVRRGVLPMLLKNIRKCWAPIDIQLDREIFPLVKVYMTVPRIVSQFDTVIPP